jgi:hypothetical protein
MTIDGLTETRRSRRGKIARLPSDIREQLNRRLDDGESGKDLVNWLNGLPEVRSVLDAKFGGQPINHVNLSNWKQGGGFDDWQARREAAARVNRVIHDVGELQSAKPGLLEDRLSVWVMSRLLLSARALGSHGGRGMDWKILRQLSRDVTNIRRGDQGAGWLRLQQARLAGQQQLKVNKG